MGASATDYVGHSFGTQGTEMCIQMAELDRDYDEYCRENERKFSSEFESWRQTRRQPSALSTGSDQDSHGQSGTIAGSTTAGGPTESSSATEVTGATTESRPRPKR